MPSCAGKSTRATPKRKLSPLRRACQSLGLPIDTRPGTNFAQRLRKGKLDETAIEYLELSRDEQARRIVELYNSLKSATERQAVTIDYLIIAAGADVHHVWGVIQEEVSRRSEIETCLLVAMHAPDVTQKIIERAKTPEGYKDRELLMRLETSLDSRVDSLVRRLCEDNTEARGSW